MQHDAPTTPMKIVTAFVLKAMFRHTTQGKRTSPVITDDGRSLTSVSLARFSSTFPALPFQVRSLALSEPGMNEPHDIKKGLRCSRS